VHIPISLFPTDVPFSGYHLVPDCQRSVLPIFFVTQHAKNMVFPSARKRHFYEIKTVNMGKVKKFQPSTLTWLFYHFNFVK
jgi:hypothetical protein